MDHDVFVNGTPRGQETIIDERPPPADPSLADYARAASFIFESYWRRSALRDNATLCRTVAATFGYVPFPLFTTMSRRKCR